METYEFILSAVGSVGFPIVACCFLGWLYLQITKVLQDLTLAINTLTTKFDMHISLTEGEDDA